MIPTVTVVGAGAVGLALAARVARTGRPVRVVVRRAEAAARLAAEGIAVEDVSAGISWTVPVEAGASLGEALGDAAAEAGVVCLCVRSVDTDGVAAALAAAAPSSCVVAVQNGVDGDALLVRRFDRVVGAVWRQTCTRRDDRSVVFAGGGRVILGLPAGVRDPAGARGLADVLADDLRRAGFDVGRSERIAADRWLKTALNLLSAPNAIVRPDEHAQAGFAELKVAILEEARAVLAAAGIDAASCDGRDPSLDAMITRHREAVASPAPRRALPIYNSAWSALQTERGALESIVFHDRFVALGAEHGVVTPVNARVRDVVERLGRERLGPESVGVADLLP